MDSDFVSMQFAEGNANTLTCNCFISRSKNGRSSFFHKHVGCRP